MRAPLLCLLVISALLVTGSEAWGWRRVWRRVVRVRGWGEREGGCRERDGETDRQTDRQREIEMEREERERDVETER